MDKKLSTSIIKIGSAAGSAAGIVRGIVKSLAADMLESGMVATEDKKSGASAEVWTLFMPSYMKAYADRVPDGSARAVIAANNIKAVPNATALDRTELNKARNAAQSVWKSAHATAFGKVQKGADQHKAGNDSGAAGETGETGTTVSTRDGAALLLANGDAPTAELLLWATGPGLKALRKWAALNMPQPK